MGFMKMKTVKEYNECKELILDFLNKSTVRGISLHTNISKDICSNNSLDLDKFIKLIESEIIEDYPQYNNIILSNGDPGNNFHSLYIIIKIEQI